MATPPPLSDDARRAALAKAAEARRVRADLKAQLKEGAVGLADVLERADAEELIAKTKVLPLIESLPGVGKVKARRTMESIGIAESRRIQGLGDKQRRALLEAFGRVHTDPSTDG
ncbi:MAG: integration host factor, actinobacterial type [Actinomycetota bacterium]